MGFSSYRDIHNIKSQHFAHSLRTQRILINSQTTTDPEVFMMSFRVIY